MQPMKAANLALRLFAYAVVVLVVILSLLFCAIHRITVFMGRFIRFANWRWRGGLQTSRQRHDVPVRGECFNSGSRQATTMMPKIFCVRWTSWHNLVTATPTG